MLQLIRPLTPPGVSGPHWLPSEEKENECQEDLKRKVMILRLSLLIYETRGVIFWGLFAQTAVKIDYVFNV